MIKYCFYLIILYNNIVLYWYNLSYKKVYNFVILSEWVFMKNGEEGYNFCRVMGVLDLIWEFVIDLIVIWVFEFELVYRE